MLKKNHFISQPEDVPTNWRDLTLILWDEDDARPIDAETLGNAFFRITGLSSDRHVHEIDEGDAFYRFYQGGWIKACCCDGGWVGVLLAAQKQEAGSANRKAVK